MQASGSLERGTWSRSLLLFKKAVAYHNWFALPERPVSDARAPFVLPEYLKMALSKSVMRNVAQFRIRGHGLKCETGLYGRSPDRSARVCNLCENWVIVHDEKHVISQVSVPNIYGTSSSIYLIIFLKVISKVLFLNIIQRFTNSLVQPSIFLIDLFVGTYRLSSHARLEAFVIQTKLNFIRAQPTHIAHTQISWTSWKRMDKLILNTSQNSMLKLVTMIFGPNQQKL